MDVRKKAAQLLAQTWINKSCVLYGGDAISVAYHGDEEGWRIRKGDNTLVYSGNDWEYANKKLMSCIEQPKQKFPDHVCKSAESLDRWLIMGESGIDNPHIVTSLRTIVDHILGTDDE